LIHCGVRGFMRTVPLAPQQLCNNLVGQPILAIGCCRSMLLGRRHGCCRARGCLRGCVSFCLIQRRYVWIRWLHCLHRCSRRLGPGAARCLGPNRRRLHCLAHVPPLLLHKCLQKWS